MTTKDKATPRPWQKYGGSYDTKIEAGGSSVANVRRPEDANLIVRAVNAHDDLVEVCNEALEFVDNYSDVVDGDYGQPRPNKAMQLVTVLRAALDKAKESKQ